MPQDSNNDSNPSSIDIHSNKGDVIGVDVDGSGNIIGKDISVVINEFSQDCGLSFIPPNYFKENTDTEENFNQWKEMGYSFSLASIYQKKGFRREKILNEIKDKLEDKKRLLLLGDTGTSKTNLLMEIICDYFDKGYRVLYNLGDDDLKNTNTIYSRVNGLVDAKNKVIVVIDNVHSPMTAIIFNVIDMISSLKVKKENIRFLLAARTPEFNLALERNLFGRNNNLVRRNIKRHFNKEFIKIIRYFDKEEIKQYIIKYKDFSHTIIRDESIEQCSKAIYEDTKGHPKMVRFAVLNKGLTANVERMYYEYLQDKNNEGHPHAKRVKTIMLNSVFDISNIPLTDELLEEFGLLSTARELKNTIIRKSGDYWETIHPKWDMELFKFMFSLENSLDDIEKAFIEIVDNITNNQHVSSKNTSILLNTIYHTIAKQDIIKKDIIEKINNIVDVENKLDDSSKPLF